MRSVVRKIWYLLNLVKVKRYAKNMKVSFSSEIKKPKEIEGPGKISANSFLSGKLGKYSYIGRNCAINGDVGRFCSIGDNVKTVEGTHPIDFVSTSPAFYSTLGQCGKYFADKDYYNEILLLCEDNEVACKIGNDVWIGENVLIKGGVCIGDGACIAMGAVVIHDVEPYTIVGGVPAKFISKRFDDETIERLMYSKWWDRSEQWLHENRNLFLDVDAFLNNGDVK